MINRVYVQVCVFDEVAASADANCAGDDVCLLCAHSMERLLEQIPTYKTTTPVCFSSAYSVLQELHTFDRVSVTQGPLRVNPTQFPHTVLNAPACYASIRHGLTGPIYNFSDGATSAVDALGFAYWQIADGQAEAVIVCASEVASPLVCRMDKHLKTSSSGALYLSARPGPLEVTDYQVRVLTEPPADQPSAYGCVEPLRRLERYLQEKAKDMVLCMTEYPYQAALTLRQPS